jgi:exopolyphosphatase/guanosine-5'-triphosphate,3'-diphosphate pyrophosphatase
MLTERRAVIDVGTNSVKLLVAEVCGRHVTPVFESGNQTRLGKGFYETHHLQPDAIARTAEAVAEFAGIARAHHADRITVFATSAARDAINGDELARAVESAAGLPLEIISGEREAEWAFQGAASDPKLADEPMLLMDLGGGSTEFILGQSGRIHVRASFPLGAVRLMETIPHCDPPTSDEFTACRNWLQHFLESKVLPVFGPALKREVELHEKHHGVLLVGVGGAATVLSRMEKRMTDYDREHIEAVRLSRDRLDHWTRELWSKSLETRRHIPGLPAERADVMLAGAVIFSEATRVLGFSGLRVTTRGVRFAALMSD